MQPPLEVEAVTTATNWQLLSDVNAITTFYKMVLVCLPAPLISSAHQQAGGDSPYRPVGAHALKVLIYGNVGM